jgi:hypothetical protein
LSWAD